MLTLTPFIDHRAQGSTVSVMEPEPAGVSPGIPRHAVGLKVSLLPVFIVDLVSQTRNGGSGLRFRFSPGVRDGEAREASLTQPGQVLFEPERVLHLQLLPAAPLAQHGRLPTPEAEVQESEEVDQPGGGPRLAELSLLGLD